jgi:ferredoxin--NADP+ reductase
MSQGDRKIVDLEAALYNASVEEVRKCGPGLRVLRIRPDAGPVAYTPGQYIGLGLGIWAPRADGRRAEEIAAGQERELMVRHYSFSHPILDPAGGGLVKPGALDTCEFYIALPAYDPGDREPRFTPRLFALQDGDRLFIESEAAGEYTADTVAPDDDVVLVATGTGEAPHNALVWHLMARGHRGRIASVVCTRFAAEQGYRETHRVLERLRPGYRYLTLTTREPGDGGGRGHLQDYLSSGDLERDLGWKLKPGRAQVFLCGNPAMIGIPKRRPGIRKYPIPRGMIEVLEGMGFNADDRSGRPDNIHYERFW